MLGRRVLLGLLLPTSLRANPDWPPDTSSTPKTLPADATGRRWLAWTGPGPQGRGVFLALEDAAGRRTPVLTLSGAYEPSLRAPARWRSGIRSVAALTVWHGLAAREVVLLVVSAQGQPVVLGTHDGNEATWQRGRDGRDRLVLWRTPPRAPLPRPRCLVWTGTVLAPGRC